MPEPVAPREVVAREQELAVMEQARGTPSVPRGWDQDDCIVERDRFQPLDHALDIARPGTDVGRVQDPFAFEVLREVWDPSKSNSPEAHGSHSVLLG